MSNNWPMVALGEALEPISRPESVQAQKTYDILGAHWYAKGLYTKAVLTGSEIRASKVYRVAKDDFVYNRLFGWKGSFAVATEKNHNCYVSNEFPCFLINRERLDKRYLWYYFSRESAWLEALGLSTGGTPTSRNRLKQEKLLAMKIPLPPLDEQRRIVARIEELAAKVERAQSLRQKSVAEVDTFIGTTTANLFQRGKEDGWKSCQIGDFATEVRYGTSDKAHDEELGIPILRMGNIQDGQLDFGDLKYVELSERDFEKLQLRPGDILVNRTNSAELVGKCAVFNVEQDFVYASYIIRLRLDESKANPHFVARYINSPLGRAYMFAERKQMTGQANINSKKLLALPLAIPPLPEQHRIVAYLDSLQAKVEAVKRHQAATAAKLDALLPSILDKAFKGEL